MGRDIANGPIGGPSPKRDKIDFENHTTKFYDSPESDPNDEAVKYLNGGLTNKEEVVLQKLLNDYGIKDGLDLADMINPDGLDYYKEVAALVKGLRIGKLQEAINKVSSGKVPEHILEVLTRRF